MLANSVEQASGLLRTVVNSFPISYRRETSDMERKTCLKSHVYFSVSL
jgi:hypothetical protein